MNDSQFVDRWVQKEKNLEAEVIENIKAIKRLRNFQDTETFWELVNSCWKFKTHVDKKNKAFKKRYSSTPEEFLLKIEKIDLIHKKKRKISKAFYSYADSIIEDLNNSSEDNKLRWLETAEHHVSTTKLNKLYKLWTDIYGWDEVAIVPQIFTQMGIYEGFDKRDKIRNSIISLTDKSNIESDVVIRYLMNQFAKKNKDLFIKPVD
jgi:hypothetical protein